MRIGFYKILYKNTAHKIQNCIFYFGYGANMSVEYLQNRRRDFPSQSTPCKLNNFKNHYSSKFEVFEGAKESGLTIGILSALIQAGTFEGFQMSRSKIVYEAQLWNILTKKEKAAG